MTILTDEHIIDLAAVHSNYHESVGDHLEYEVISHQRLIAFGRAIEDVVADRYRRQLAEQRALVDASVSALMEISAKMDRLYEDISSLARQGGVRA